MITIDRYKELKQKVERLQRESDRAEGERTQLMKRLKEEFDCETLAQADAMLVRLQTKAKKAQEDFDEALEDFEGEWADVMEK